MKKHFIIILVLILLIFEASFLTAFKSCKKDPWTIRNTIWYSEEPEIEVLTDHTGYVMVSGEKLDITIGRNPSNYFYIFDAKVDRVAEEDIFLKGKYVYKDNKIIVTVIQDKLFDNKYSEIVFEARVTE